MNIPIDTGNFLNDTLLTECPKCKKNVSAIILNEYDFYSELYHDERSCGTEWSYSSYKQCKLLQRVYKQQLLQECPNTLNQGEKIASAVMRGQVYFYGFIFGGPVGLLAVKVADYFLDIDGRVLEAKKKEASNNSWNISHFFENLSNHHLDPKFVKERGSNFNPHIHGTSFRHISDHHFF